MNPDNRTERCFKAYYSELAEIARFTLDYAKRYGFEGKALYAIELSLDEACANVIDHAYQGEGLGDIEVSLSYEDPEFIIELGDSGRPFDADKVPMPDLTSPLEERSERGLGVYTVKALMDRVIFCRKGSKNCLIMTKRKP